jgi:uncharacterized membrane protein
MSSILSDLTSGDPHLSFGERAVSVVLGLGLAAAAAKPRPNPLLNLLALAGGSYLAYRGATGYCPVKAALADQGRPGRLPPEPYARGERLPELESRGSPERL